MVRFYLGRKGRNGGGSWKVIGKPEKKNMLCGDEMVERVRIQVDSCHDSDTGPEMRCLGGTGIAREIRVTEYIKYD